MSTKGISTIQSPQIHLSLTHSHRAFLHPKIPMLGSFKNPSHPSTKVPKITLFFP